ncbi:hypothetical protein BXZ70DRAFT_900986 [Cristinia sonorae]|uniref:NADH:flavin oxidoreductase/NADH oxidase N-terminal domain-containing protein n=1 Tax=Cristinia sonorae TaxID=1940300 RepID=A0A8K0UG21_9AGAR|nr:hypothetical protein BXZ70DRAFT_900986 [Cristinia sonorae]
MTEGQDIFSPVELPCGRKLQNRMVKVALYEHSAALLGGPPNDVHFGMYSRWGAGGWGMVITGNMQVSNQHLGLGRDVTLPKTLDEVSLRPYRKLASCMHGDDPQSRPLAIVQLCHTGRQSGNIIGGRPANVPPLAPSAVPLELKPRNAGSKAPLMSVITSKLMFTPPRAMTIQEIDNAVDEFVKGAQMAARAGFDGVQIHAAHGYLVAQFMSQRSNIRTDEYGKDRLLFLRRIVTAIRAPGVVPKDFALGIKMNAADYVDTSSGPVANEDRALEHFRTIATWGLLDFIEVSGGDYDSPDFMAETKVSRRQAVFEGFSSRAMQYLTIDKIQRRPLILLTGGLRTPELLKSALAKNHTDLLGLGRTAVVRPDLPKRLAENPDVWPEPIFPLFDAPAHKLPLRFFLEDKLALLASVLWDLIPPSYRPAAPGLVGAGAETARHDIMLQALARNAEKLCYPGSDFAAMVRFWLYTAPGGSKSRVGLWITVLALILCAIALFKM